jgi:hypothetical protein
MARLTADVELVEIQDQVWRTQVRRQWFFQFLLVQILLKLVRLRLMFQ